LTLFSEKFVKAQTTAVEEIQSFVEYAVGSNINRVMLKDNQMWTKTYPQSGVGVDWAAWNGPYALSSFPGTGTVYGYSESPVGTNINRVLIRGGEMWTKTYPQSGVGVDWAAWNGPWVINSFPGTGEIQSFTEYPMGTDFKRVLIRGNQMWTKTYPQSGVGVDWAAWNGPFALTSFPRFPDANGDGIVDLADFDRWKREYLGILTTKTANFNPSIDDVVDLADFDIWKRSYLTSSSVSPVISCTSFSDSFSTGVLDTAKWNKWQNNTGASIGMTNGQLTFYNTQGAEGNNGQSVFINPISGDFSVEVNLKELSILNNKTTSDLILQFAGEGWVNYVTVFKRFNATPGDVIVSWKNNGVESGAILLGNFDKATPVKVKIQRNGSTVKVYYDKMDGLGYVMGKQLDGFDTGPIVPGVSLSISGPDFPQSLGIIDDFKLTCL
jgi:hypothetical protein